jgi:hypothetical protein
MWLNVVLLVAVLLVLALVIAGGAVRWRVGSERIRRALEAGRVPVGPARHHARDVEDLPAPVRRYFQLVLAEGQPIVAAARIKQVGQFNRGTVRAQWNRFDAEQCVVTQRPGFDWDARIVMAPGLSVRVHDAYVNGEGLLHAAMSGLITLAEVRGGADVAQGELMRFLAEAAWYPTALLPSQGVHWEAIDDVSARATLCDGPSRVSLVFEFDADGLVCGARACSRQRMVAGGFVPTPWRGRFWNYAVRDGMRIPLEGEVAWERPDGLWPYWRGRITDIVYDVAR